MWNLLKTYDKFLKTLMKRDRWLSWERLDHRVSDANEHQLCLTVRTSWTRPCVSLPMHRMFKKTSSTFGTLYPPPAYRHFHTSDSRPASFPCCLEADRSCNDHDPEELRALNLPHRQDSLWVSALNYTEDYPVMLPTIWNSVSLAHLVQLLHLRMFFYTTQYSLIILCYFHITI